MTTKLLPLVPGKLYRVRRKIHAVPPDVDGAEDVNVRRPMGFWMEVGTVFMFLRTEEYAYKSLRPDRKVLFEDYYIFGLLNEQTICMVRNIPLGIFEDFVKEHFEQVQTDTLVSQQQQ